MFSSRRGTVRHFHFQEISPKKFMPRNDGDKFSFWHKPLRVVGEQSTSSTWIWNKWFQAKRRLKIGVFIIVQGDFPPNKCPPGKIMETSKRSHCFREDKAGIRKRSEEGKRKKRKKTCNSILSFGRHCLKHVQTALFDVQMETIHY